MWARLVIIVFTIAVWLAVAWVELFEPTVPQLFRILNKLAGQKRQISNPGWRWVAMSALGQKQTYAVQNGPNSDRDSSPNNSADSNARG